MKKRPTPKRVAPRQASVKTNKVPDDAEYAKAFRKWLIGMIRKGKIGGCRNASVIFHECKDASDSFIATSIYPAALFDEAASWRFTDKEDNVWAVEKELGSIRGARFSWEYRDKTCKVHFVIIEQVAYCPKCALRHPLSLVFKKDKVELHCPKTGARARFEPPTGERAKRHLALQLKG